ncbi:porin [Cupriavidus sp. YAF13]|uniref:porin n=1 Tax=Cupriavidus sp. YAF13 TaxID=3233075 RepID=UPI003F92AE20
MRMKLLAATMAALAAGGANAQSSVTLYGVADAGLEYTNKSSATAAGAPGGNAYRLTSGNQSGSRWGMRGVEDIGGGLKGIFVLESGVNFDTGASGQGGRLFGRAAYVGLQSPYGTFTLGRHTTPFFDFGLLYDPMAISTRYGITSTAPEFGSRADNSGKYIGTFGGLTVSGLYSFTNNGNEVPGAFTNGREYSFLASYAAGPLAVGAAYDQANNTAAASAQMIRRATAAGSYTLGAAKAFLGYRWAKAYNGASLPGGQFANGGSNLYWTGLAYQLTPAFSLTGAAYYQDFRNSGADPWDFVATADYALSKRTDLYASLSYVKNKGNSNLSVNGFNNNSPTDSAYVQAGASQIGATVGIRHKF